MSSLSSLLVAGGRGGSSPGGGYSTGGCCICLEECSERQHSSGCRLSCVRSKPSGKPVGKMARATSCASFFFVKKEMPQSAARSSTQHPEKTRTAKQFAGMLPSRAAAAAILASKQPLLAAAAAGAVQQIIALPTGLRASSSSPGGPENVAPPAVPQERGGSGGGGGAAGMLYLWCMKSSSKRARERGWGAAACRQCESATIQCHRF